MKVVPVIGVILRPVALTVILDRLPTLRTGAEDAAIDYNPVGGKLRWFQWISTTRDAGDGHGHWDTVLKPEDPVSP